MGRLNKRKLKILVRTKESEKQNSAVFLKVGLRQVNKKVFVLKQTTSRPKFL